MYPELTLYNKTMMYILPILDNTLQFLFGEASLFLFLIVICTVDVKLKVF